MGERGRPKHPDVLTPRQFEVLELVREGLTNPQIAERLGISPDGAKWHVKEILWKLDVPSREEAGRWRSGDWKLETGNWSQDRPRSRGCRFGRRSRNRRPGHIALLTGSDMGRGKILRRLRMTESGSAGFGGDGRRACCGWGRPRSCHRREPSLRSGRCRISTTRTAAESHPGNLGNLW